MQVTNMSVRLKRLLLSAQLYLLFVYVACAFGEDEDYQRKEEMTMKEFQIPQVDLKEPRDNQQVWHKIKILDLRAIQRCLLELKRRGK